MEKLNYLIVAYHDKVRKTCRHVDVCNQDNNLWVFFVHGNIYCNVFTVIT